MNNITERQLFSSEFDKGKSNQYKLSTLAYSLALPHGPGLLSVWCRKLDQNYQSKIENEGCSTLLCILCPHIQQLPILDAFICHLG